jgi:ABC-type antimicrobial peptide transport system permease subunit
MSWLSRLKNTLRPNRLDEDLEEEIREHLELRTEQYRGRGLEPQAAAEQANALFGNTTLIREQSREFRLSAWLDATIQDVRYAWRGMLKNKGFAATAVLSLGLAIGANTAIYSIIDAAILRPLPLPEAGRLFTLGEGDAFSFPVYDQFRSTAPLAAFASVDNVEVQQGVEVTAPYEKVNQQLVSGDSFDILKVHPTAGRLFTAVEDQGNDGHQVTVLSYDYWQRRFGGDLAIIGRTIRIAGRTSPFRIIGVTQQGFFGVEPGKFVDLWLPLKTFDPDAFTNPDFRWLHLMGRGDGTAQKQFRVHPGSIGGYGFQRTFGRALWILFGVAMCILLIASANVASLLLARSAARSAEMALRVSLGAARTRLIRQLTTESLLLSALAGLCGWAFARIAAPLFAAALSRPTDPVQLALSMDTRVLIFCAGICALSGLFFGLLPAWHATAAQQPILALRHASGQAGKLRMGRFFLGVQVAFAFCLVVVGFGFLFSLRNLFAIDPGFDPRGVTVLTVSNDSRKLQMEVMRQLPHRLASITGIQNSAIGWGAIFIGARRAEPVVLPGKRSTGRQEMFYRVSPGYFAAMKTPLLEGRDLTLDDNENGPTVPTVVNRSFARRYFGSDKALGREFQRTDGTRHQIVGLAADAYLGDLRNGPQPVAYFPLKPGARFVLYVRSSIDPFSLSRIVEREARAITPGIHITDTTTLDALVGNTLFKEKLLAGAGGLFALLALALASVGLFGLLSYSVSRRTKELGIRTTLGAARGSIVALICRDLLAMTTGGLIAGVAGSLVTMRILKAQLFGIGTVDPVVLGTAAALFLIAALVAGGMPALRAASVDPVIALREE